MGAEPWHYDTADDVDRTIIERLRQFPREPDMLVYGARMVAGLCLRGWLRTYHRLTVVGRENLPQEGSFVLVANHASHLDAVAILAALPLRKVHRVFPAAAKDFFFVRVPRVAVAAVVVNALPFDREVSPRQSLRLCSELLANSGNVLLLFPEGTRSITGELGEFKPGIGLLLAGAEYPAIPCYLDGAYRAMPKGSCFPRPRRVRLTIGKPHHYAGLKRGKQSAMQICQELHDAVAALANP